MNNYQNIIKKIAILAIICSVSTSAFSNGDSSFAIGAKVGTQGVGIEARFSMTENLYGRFGVNYFHYKKTFEQDAIKHHGKFTLMTVPFMFDYHPSVDSGFRLSAGVAYNGIQLTSTATPTPGQTLKLEGHSYSAGQITKIKEKLHFKNKIAPVLSIGYDSSLLSQDPLSFNFELGAMYIGKAKASVSVDGASAREKQAIDDATKNLNKAIDSTKTLKFWPIASIGFKYNF